MLSSSKNKTCVIIGASHAGSQVAESVRKSGWQGTIALLGDESSLPYQRPPLSKDFLLGKKQVSDILIKPASHYEKHGVQTHLNTYITKLDRDSKQLITEDGQSVAYDKLVLAVGARVRQIPIPGVDKKGVFYLRTVDDIARIQTFVRKGAKAIIVGGGYIGLETAAALRGLEVEVTVLEMMPRILQRVTAPDLSNFYCRIHAEEGVNIVTDTQVKAIDGDESVSTVICEGGRSYSADFVIIGAGIIPNIELAKHAGLKTTDGGIVVDEFCVTSDPDIFSAGDCTWQHNPIYNRWMRLESVPNAVDQARVVGASVCGIREKPHHQLPWFWSDQYNLKLQIAGLSQGFDNVVIRGDHTKGRKFAAFYFQADHLLAVDAVNMPAAFMLTKRLLSNGKKGGDNKPLRTIDKIKLADLNTELKTLL